MTACSMTTDHHQSCSQTNFVPIHCVQKKVSPLKILQYHEENFTELNIILPKDSHMTFKQWCEVSAKYTLAFVRNQTLNKTGQKFD